MTVLIAYRLYIKMKMKENIMEDLESRSLSYIIVEEFLVDLKEEFGRGDNEVIKVAELKKVEYVRYRICPEEEIIYGKIPEHIGRV